MAVAEEAGARVTCGVRRRARWEWGEQATWQTQVPGGACVDVHAQFLEKSETCF
jgi:hypothetical protein